MIELKHVDKIYPNGFKALEDINLKIQDGEFVAVIGLSGAGKSTMIRCINRMLDIQSGIITINQVDISKLTQKQLRTFRRKIAMVFQSFNLITKTSAINNVISAKIPDMPLWRTITGIFKQEDKIQALEMLNKVGILDKSYIRCDKLSGGEQQRVALARALNQNPNIILADEPVASLDPITADQIMNDFKKINKELNITIIMNIHNVELALKYADRIIGIKKGKIVFDGMAKKIDKNILDTIYSN